VTSSVSTAQAAASERVASQERLAGMVLEQLAEVEGREGVQRC
jgi:hypothetical protein